MKKRTLREIYIPINVFHSQTIVLVGHNKTEVQKWIKKNIEKEEIKEEALKGIEEVSNTTRARTVLLSGGGSIIWMIEMDNGTLVHEIFHAVSHLLSQRQTPLNESTEEVYAYLIEYLTKSCNI